MDSYYNNNNNNMDYYTPQNAGYYQNNGRGGGVGGPYSKNGYDNNPYPRSPQYSENHLEQANNNYNPQYVNNPPANYNNGGKNGYNNTDPYYSNIKSTSPGGSAYGDDSGYSNPHSLLSHPNARYNNQNPHTTPFDNTNPSYNTPYPPSPMKNPSSPVMPGINPAYPPINPIPAHQAPYGNSGRQAPYGDGGRQAPYGDGGHPTDPYSGGASKEMYSSSMPSSNLGSTNYGQENQNPISPSSAYSKKPFLDYDDDDEKKRAKPDGIMKYCCCGGRSTCCKICAVTCCIFLLLIIGIVVAVLLWARPPKVEFLGIVPSPNNLPAYSANPTGFDFNFGLKIQVDNPNVVGANFEMIKAIAFYPGHPDPIGGGNLTNVEIASKGKTTVDFPFSVNYNKDIDPGFTILLDIARKCGLTEGATKQKLEIDYKLTLTVKVILFNINPSFDRKAMIDCPIKDGKIPNIPGFDIGKAAKGFGKKKKRDSEIQKSPMALFNK